MTVIPGCANGARGQSPRPGMAVFVFNRCSSTSFEPLTRSLARYACQQCGAIHAKWTGRCDGCGAWNSLIEELPRDSPPSGLAKGGLAKDRRGGRSLGFVGLTGPSVLPPRRLTGIAELDRVCGGGFVPGSAILVGGDPGIGKSTLLLQAAAAIASSPVDSSGRPASAAYITGEEAIDQVRLRRQLPRLLGRFCGPRQKNHVRAFNTGFFERRQNRRFAALLGELTHLFTQRRDQFEILPQSIAGEQVANLAAGQRLAAHQRQHSGSSQSGAPVVWVARDACGAAGRCRPGESRCRWRHSTRRTRPAPAANNSRLERLGSRPE